MKKTESITKSIESINIDFKNNVVTTVYAGEKYAEKLITAADGLTTVLTAWGKDNPIHKDRYFTDGFTIAKNPKIVKYKIEFDSHICLGIYSKGGWLPINEYNINWAKASKKQRNEFKRVEKEFDIKDQALLEIASNTELMSLINYFFLVQKSNITDIYECINHHAISMNGISSILALMKKNGKGIEVKLKCFLDMIGEISDLGINSNGVYQELFCKSK